MAEDELIDSRVSVKQCRRAVDAIHSYQAKKTDKESANELLPGKEQIVWLNVAVKKVAAERKIMPVRIPVVHPIVDPRTSGVCLITKDPQREYKDLLEANDIKFISRVVGITKLKGKFKPFEARRILLKENGLFLADDRVIPLLPKLLGEKWFNAKKQPIPVTLTRKDLKKELEHAIQSTYMNQNRGTNTAIKIGNMTHTPAQILANLKVALPVIAKRISGGWDNVQALSIKTSSSASLPIWSCPLGDEEGGRWAGLNVDPDAESSGEGDDDEAMEVDKPASKKPKSPSNGKKRAAADDEPEETSKPKKKTKGAEGKSAPEPSKAEKGKALVTADASPKKEKVKAATSSATKVAVDSSKKSKALAPKDSVPPATKPTPSADAPSTSDDSNKSKKRKAKASSDASVPVPAPVPAPGPSPTSETKKLKKKVPEITQPVKKDEGTGTKQAKKQNSVNKEIDTPSTVDGDAKSKKVSPKETVAPSVSAPVDGPSKKDKKSKKAKSTDDGVAKAPADSLTADDLKKKRSAAPGEKKKDKVVKAKGGKSAKNEIIGKKTLVAGELNCRLPIAGPHGWRHTNGWLLRTLNVPMAASQRTSTKISIPHSIEPNCSIVGILQQLTPDQPTNGKRIALILHGSAGHKDYLFHKHLGLCLPLDSFRFDFRGCHETPGTWRQHGFEDDVADISIVVDYLAKTFGYQVDLIVGHSRGSLVAIRWLCTTEAGKKVSGFVNVSGRYRMHKIRETPLAKKWSESFLSQGFHIWTPTVARKILSIKIHPEDVENFCKFDTSLVWDRFPQGTDVLTIHGLSDTQVPPYDAVIYARALSNRDPGTHSLHLMEHADHNFIGRQDEVVATILEWWAARERGDLQSGIWRGTAADLRGKM